MGSPPDTMRGFDYVDKDGRGVPLHRGTAYYLNVTSPPDSAYIIEQHGGNEVMSGGIAFARLAMYQSVKQTVQADDGTFSTVSRAGADVILETIEKHGLKFSPAMIVALRGHGMDEKRNREFVLENDQRALRNNCWVFEESNSRLIPPRGRQNWKHIGHPLIQEATSRAHRGQSAIRDNARICARAFDFSLGKLAGATGHPRGFLFYWEPTIILKDGHYAEDGYGYCILATSSALPGTPIVAQMYADWHSDAQRNLVELYSKQYNVIVRGDRQRSDGDNGRFEIEEVTDDSDK